MVKVWEGRVIGRLKWGWGGPLVHWKIQENTWASFTLLLKTLKQANQHNPTILQVSLGLFKTCGTTVFESSCVRVGDREVETDIQLYTDSDPSLCPRDK